MYIHVKLILFAHNNGWARPPPWGHHLPPALVNKEKLPKDRQSHHRGFFFPVLVEIYVIEKPVVWYAKCWAENAKQQSETHKSDMQHVSPLIQLCRPCRWESWGPIQTLSICSGAPSPSKHSLFTVGLCLDLCHITLWPCKKRLLRLVRKKENSELLWGSAQQGLVFLGFITFSAYWLVWLAVFPNLNPTFLHDLLPVVFRKTS